MNVIIAAVGVLGAWSCGGEIQGLASRDLAACMQLVDSREIKEATEDRNNCQHGLAAYLKYVILWLYCIGVPG